MVTVLRRFAGTPKRPVESLPPEVATMALRITSHGLAFWAVGFGLVTALGGRERWAGEAYRVALDFPWAPQSWGVILTAIGVCLSLGVVFKNRLLIEVSGLGGLGWCTVYGASLMAVALDNPQVGFAPVITQVVFGVQFAVRAAIGFRWRL